MRHLLGQHPARRLGFTALVGLAVLAAATAAVSSSAGTAAVTASGASSVSQCAPPAPSALPKDPNGVVHKLTGLARAAFGGYPVPVYKSPLLNFKSKKSGHWVVGMSNNEGNQHAVQLLDGFKQVQKAHPTLISKIISVTATPPNDVPTQIQQMRSLIQRHVDIILATLSSPTALNAVIDEAWKVGIPVISVESESSNKRAVNVEPNIPLLGYLGAKLMVDQMGDKGNVLVVDGLGGISGDKQNLDAALAVFKACPDIKIVGTFLAGFDPGQAKTKTIQFLATHPDPVDGVFQVFNMAQGIISAFEQSGRPVPPVAATGADEGSLAYWRDHKSTYKGSGVGLPITSVGAMVMEVGLGILEGRGIKLTAAPFSPVAITAANLSQWVKADWTTESVGSALGPATALPVKALLAQYFTRPGA
jgi:ribose transport system substrate-binding protein